MANPAAERAQKLAEALRRQRDQGGSAYPLTLAQLGTLAAPEASPEDVAKAAGKEPFASAAVLARKKDPGSPVALAEDGERLARAPLLLEFALGKLCKPETPLQPLAKVVQQVEKSLRGPFEAALRRQLDENALPETVGSRTEKNKSLLYLKQFPPSPPPKPPAVELSEKLVQTLASQRTLGGASYPLTLDRLHELTDAAADSKLRKKAQQAEPFRSQAVLAAAKKADSPVALAADRDVLLDSLLLLEYALTAVCKPAKAVQPLSQIVKQVDAPLREAFEAALRRRLESGPLPEGIGELAGKGAPSLYLKKYPPPPPRRPAAEVLAEQLVHVLVSTRREEASPVPLDDLVRQADPQAPPTVVNKALKTEPFKSQVLVLLPKGRPVTVALARDAERVAGRPRLLEAALAAARTPDNQAVAVADLKKQVAKELQQSFEQAVSRKTEANTLPPGVGCLRIKKKPHLFLLADIGAPPPAPAAHESAVQPSAAPPVMDFAGLFEEAFARLDRAAGGHNHVSLVALRQAVPVERATFDTGLHELRRAGRYSLSAAEGRDGITPEERTAAIPEHGALLLFVARRTS